MRPLFHLFLFFIFLSPETIHAKPSTNLYPVIINSKTELNKIGNKVGVFCDSSNSYDILKVYNSEKYIQYPQKTPNLGLNEYARYIKFQLINRTDNKNLAINFDLALLNEIVFYRFDNMGFLIDSQMAGEKVSHAVWPVKFPSPAFKFTLDKNDTAFLMLKINSIATLQLDLKAGTIESLYEAVQEQEFYLGIYYGIIIVMFLYNLFIYFSSKEEIYKYYSIYLIALFIIQITLDGYGFMLLWPGNTWLSQQSFFLFTILVNIVGIEFVKRYLHTYEMVPKADKIAYIIYLGYAICLLTTLSGHRLLTYQIMQPLAGLAALYMLFLGIIVYNENRRAARFFLIAWIPLIVGIVIYVLKDRGAIEHTNFTHHSIQFGTAFEVILLSFAVADKINVLRNEKEEILAHQKDTLKIQVDERTQELNKALVELRNAQSRLVESEKMSSLGQLTAGLAHEINNPVNFISSAIPPLQRDIDDLLKLLTLFDEFQRAHPGKNEFSHIENFKELVDIDYVKTEVKELLKAVMEGADRTATIIKGLKDFSRIDELDLKQVDIHEGINSTLMLLQNQLGSNIKVIKKYNSLPLVECYLGKLNQVFMNILSNAILSLKSSKQPDPLITISTYFSGTRAIICMADNGPGIPKELQEKIFEPFFTTRPPGEGTGLGLSIVFNIIEAHNGHIELKSEPGKGTEFIIVIPIKQHV